MQRTCMRRSLVTALAKNFRNTDVQFRNTGSTLASLETKDHDRIVRDRSTRARALAPSERAEYAPLELALVFMPSKCFITLAAVSFALACSSSGQRGDGAAGTGGGANNGRCRAASAGHSGAGTAGLVDQSSDDAAIAPAGLAVSALEGGNGVLDVIALTLRAGASATHVYAALRNDGDVPACSAGVSVQLFDHSGQSIAASITGLFSNNLFRFTDGSGTIVSCVAPGSIAMGAIQDLPADIVIDDVAAVVYQTPYFALDVAPVAGHLDVSGVKAVRTSDGTAFTGTVVNGLDFTVSDPGVSVFPVNCAGRPLGVATATGSGDVAPRGTWSFQTNGVDTVGVDAAAYPTASRSSGASP
jgi:hypothetical protein